MLKSHSKAFEKVSNNLEIKDALGQPIVKGPWYNASLAVDHKRQSVSCSFPVSGPQGTGVVQLKAVRNGGIYNITYVHTDKRDLRRTCHIDTSIKTVGQTITKLDVSFHIHADF